jgi:hypothetical protein
VLVGPVLGETTPHFPLYIVEALCVEAVALRWDGRRPFTLGAVSGALIGSVGFFAEYAWSQTYVNHWTSSLIPEGLPLALIVGVAAGILGGAIGRAVTPDAERDERVPGWVLPAAGLAIIGVCIWSAPQPVPKNPPKATVTLADVKGSGKQREAFATVRLQPTDAADDARWLTITAWQGGGKVVNRLEKIGPGAYRSTQPIPLYGNWKSTLRLQRGREVLGLPIYMAEDKAIPVKEIPARPSFTRPFQLDKKSLQREQKKGVSPFLTTAAYLIVLGIGLGLAAALAWGLARFARRERTTA